MQKVILTVDNLNHLVDNGSLEIVTEGGSTIVLVVDYAKPTVDEQSVGDEVI